MTSRPAIQLVHSEIIHVRHGKPSHRLKRTGLSLWLDIDRLEEAHTTSPFFSVNRFNLLSFYEADFGCNHAAFKTKGQKTSITPLNQYVREQIHTHIPDAQINSIHILAFPRILGLSFNPITVYVCNVEKTGDILMYEVHNTFGDCHTYFAVCGSQNDQLSHQVDKKLHVSPFFDMQGGYHLGFKQNGTNLKLLVRYSHNAKARLTATLQGTLLPLTTFRIAIQLLTHLHFPMRVWAGIHLEAVKLIFKKCRFYRRPSPPHNPITIAKPASTSQKG